MAPHPVDYYVGRRLRSRRTMLGMSQENLGAAVGVTFQQIQKYERGLNRIGASRLYEFARVLNVSVSYFFEDLAGHAGSNQESQAATEGGMAENADLFVYENLGSKEILTLVRSYYEIEDTQIRRKVLSLIRSLAATPSLGEEEEEEEEEIEEKSRVEA